MPKCGSCYFFEFLYKDAPLRVGNCIAGGFNTYDNEDCDNCEDYTFAKRWHRAAFPVRRMLP